VEPVSAVLLAVRVSVLFVSAGLAPNFAVTPLGRPEAERVTKPTSGVTRITVAPLLPCTTVRDLGSAESVNFNMIVSLIVVICTRLPDLPVMVTVASPTVAVGLALKVTRVLLVPGLGLNAAVTPLGKPEAENSTLSLKPFVG
jgi:hypothetical protein